MSGKSDIFYYIDPGFGCDRHHSLKLFLCVRYLLILIYHRSYLSFRRKRERFFEV